MSLSNLPTKEFISPVIRGRMPSFVLSDYTNFANFMTKYFEWMEQDGKWLDIVETWKHNVDITNEVEPYASAILNDLGWTWQGDMTVPKKVMIHVLRDFYLSRGTVKSFQFLFSVLFNEKVRIQYPRERLMITSGAEYLSKNMMYCTFDNKDTEAYDNIVKALASGESVFIQGLVSGAMTAIEKIQSVLSSGKEYLSLEVVEPLNVFIPKEEIRIIYGDNTIVEKLYNILGLEVENGANNARQFDKLTVTGAGLFGAAIIKNVKSGSIEKVSVISGGAGYKVGDKVLADYPEQEGFGFYGSVHSVDAAGAVTTIKMHSGGYGYKYLPKLYIISDIGESAVLAAESNEIGSITGIGILEPIVDFDPSTIQVKYKSSTGADAEFKVYELAIFTSKFYRKRQGVLGENSTIIDSYRYQQFSYDVVSSLQSDKYDSIVKDLLHPIGYVRSSVFEMLLRGFRDFDYFVESEYSTEKSDTFIFTLSGDSITTLSEDNLIAL